MTQLSYQPAFDSFHAVYRLLRIRESILPYKPLPKDHLRILDFYLLFPFRIEGLRLQVAHKKFKRLAKDYLFEKPYGDLPEDKIIFNRMKAFQNAALDTLVKKGLLHAEKYDSGIIEATEAQVPEEIRNRLLTDNTKQANLIEFINALADYELLGDDGLKKRSGLMEYRYDAV